MVVDLVTTLLFTSSTLDSPLTCCCPGVRRGHTVSPDNDLLAPEIQGRPLARPSTVLWSFGSLCLFRGPLPASLRALPLLAAVTALQNLSEPPRASDCGNQGQSIISGRQLDSRVAGEERRVVFIISRDSLSKAL